MPGPAKVIVVDADPAATAALRFGLSRAGLTVDTATAPADVASAAGTAGLILVADAKDGIGTVSAIRAELDDAALLTPILFIGGAERRAVERAGASEVLAGPPALRDIANVARLMLGERRGEGWGGTLAETTGVFGLVRALSTLGRSGVLTLTRGVRRGEVRYYHGEITSAQVGMIHGQAAFHQLLLWTDAKYDFRHEIIVRRRQIPLSPEEVIADAEQFLESTRDIAGGLSPSVVLDVVSERIAALAIKIPTEVHGILNMFDGRRTLVDILEDSPYRVHETLRVARKGYESKVLRAVPSSRPKPTWRAVLSLEEWLLGAQPMVPRPARLPGEGVASAPAAGSSGAVPEAVHEARTVKYGENGAAVRRDPGPLEWADLVPRTSGLEMPMLSPIVPATKASGEVEMEATDGARSGQLAAIRSVIVSEDAVISPEERAEEERLVEERKRAEREAIAKEIEAARAAKAEAAAKEAAAKEAAAKAEAAKAEAAAKEAAAKEAAAKAEAAAKEAAAREAAAKEAAAKEAAAKEAAEAAAREAAAKEAAAREAAAKEVAAQEAAAKEAAAREAAAQEAAAKEAAARDAAAREAAVKEAAAKAELAAREIAAREAERARLQAEEEERLENEKTTKIDRRAPTASDAPSDRRAPTASDTSKGNKKRKKERHKPPVAGIPVVSAASLANTVKAEVAKPDPKPDAKTEAPVEPRNEVKSQPQASPAKPARASTAPIADEPAVLVADLQAAHAAASSVAKTQAAAKSSPDVGAAHGKVVEQVKSDASKATAAFTADEEAFFQKDAHAAVDSFDDLDVGYRRPTFWQRLLGKAKPGS